MSISKLFIVTFLSFYLGNISFFQAQNGDQILDGIGETGLIARYTFEGNLKDWSRNNLHGASLNGKPTFIKDAKFDKVLSLSSVSNSYISIPESAIINEESLSLSGWFKLNSVKERQYFFDFGNNTSHFSLATVNNHDAIELETSIQTVPGKTFKTHSEALAINKWNYFAVIIDIPSKSLSTYINGMLVGRVTGITIDLKDLFRSKTRSKNFLYIGKSIASEQTSLDAKLHDFRIYRIPLTQKQVKRIYNQALNGEDIVVNTKKEKDSDLPFFDKKTPQLYTKYLVSIPEIIVETTVGNLPRLPRYVKGVYNINITNKQTRIIWPSPKDNSSVLKEGTYIVKGTIPGSAILPVAKVVVKKVVKTHKKHQNLEVFNLEEVSLNTDINGQSTKFIQNRDKFISTLKTTNPDAFLYMFRNAFGQEQPKGVAPLEVWDSQDSKLRGHATGHYLTAIAQAYASTGYDASLQNNFKSKMNYMVEVLYDLSQLSGTATQENNICIADPLAVPPAKGKSDYESDLSKEGIRTDYWNWGKGFISAYPPDQFIMLEKGAKYGTENTKIWAPYYTLHKIMAGLMDVYEVSGNKKALTIAKGMGNWVHARLSVLPTTTLLKMWSTYIAGEFGGMNEVMARLYSVTHEKKYLDTAKSFDNIKMFFGNSAHTHGLAKNVDTFRGLHANQHIPQIVGALEIYRDSEALEYYHIADNFWNKVTNDYAYSIGGVAGARNPANAECFISQPATIYENGLSSGGQNETCATYNMLKLTKNLFLFDQNAAFMDYYEQGLYNHILASVAENTPANTYHIPLRPGAIKQFSNPAMKGFTCCNGTALESSTKLQNAIYFKSENSKALFVNLFVPSTLKWTDRKVTITQSTAFPREDFTKLTINGKGKFAINIRVPKWATKGFSIKINGKEQKIEATPSSYVSLHRKWKNEDTIEVHMPFQFYLNPVMDQQNIASLFYGPILLAAQETEAKKEWRKVTLDAKDIGKSIKGDPEKLEFLIDGVLFKPFYDSYERHSVYLDVSLK